jgi:hypothetical protein
MAYVKTNRAFVYGNFLIGKKTGYQPIMQPFAIEILREFSGTEFVGKLYIRVADSWLPATRTMLLNYDWYTAYERTHSARLAPPQSLHFGMEGSGTWQVENFRDESDESGPYVAVALKFRSR